MGKIEAQYIIDQIGTQITRNNNAALLLKEKLRELLFKRVKQVDGQSVYYPIDDLLPEEAETDGDTWRLHIGNNPLQINRLVLTGGGAVIGRIPSGLPMLNIPTFRFDVIWSLFPFAVIISLLGFMEAISLGFAFCKYTNR